ncbi:MAG: bifunctional 3-deoxy-7-phosphoheptulonate synthase/chorismate mutase type II [Saprospiraceae bacterium]
MNFKPAVKQSFEKKVLILGPCSAESYEQLELVVLSTKELNPDLIRAGVWKPRTRPGHFQGIGEKALEWIEDLSKKYACNFCTEVANAKHVEKCLEAGIKTLWIGARTTVNPFYVQEIADAVKGVNVNIMIKNPLNPDLYLWLGAIERIYEAGVNHISAIHRGFSFYGNSIYRNVPRWQIPLELRRRLPDLQLIADISHISGTPEHLLEIAQISMDLNYDGLMVETHPNPQQALSDADQQVTMEFLKNEILGKLIQRSQSTADSEFNNRINKIRANIDQIDQHIIELLGERMLLAETIGDEKKLNGISIFQPDRWNEIIQKLKSLALENGLSEEFVFSLIEAIHIESIQHQSRKMNEG